MLTINSVTANIKKAMNVAFIARGLGAIQVIKPQRLSLLDFVLFLLL